MAGKLYKAGQTKPASQGGGKVKSGTAQGPMSKKNDGKTHSVKGRSINHGRSK
ncbi:MAG TPA: hypothetical protein VHD87_15145 [Acidimicrobiales bacterium]|nr:hypothetical protein [Acidimicrobiales bacterium]